MHVRLAVSVTAWVAVDSNAGEDKIYNTLKNHLDHDMVIRHRLDVGDIEIHAPDSDRTMVIERKTWDDLGKSLRDGRYADQKARLLSDGEHSTATVVYIVEGYIRGWFGTTGPSQAPIPNAQLEAAILKTTLRDQIPVLRTKDTNHTCAVVLYLFQQMQEGTLYAPTTTRSLATSKRRGDNVDPWQSMLMGMPGMSADKAAAVATKYPSMGALHAADPKELADVRVEHGAKKARRLGPALANKLAALR